MWPFSKKPKGKEEAVFTTCIKTSELFELLERHLEDELPEDYSFLRLTRKSDARPFELTVSAILQYVDKVK